MTAYRHPNDDFTTITDETQLIAAIGDEAVDTIFIPNDVVITLTDTIVISRSDLVIFSSRNQLDASGRLLDGAGLVLAEESSDRPLFRVVGDNVRFTGLRFESADSAGDGVGVKFAPPVGRMTNTIRIDNSELSYFGRAAIELRGRPDLAGEFDAQIRYNYIHHNNLDNLGYGVLLSGEHAAATIFRNHFDENRHSVAATGDRFQSYHADQNFTFQNNKSHEYDMHGYSDQFRFDCAKLQQVDPTVAEQNPAGETILITDNYLHHGRELFVLRGIPADVARVEGNIAPLGVLYRLWRGVDSDDVGDGCTSEFSDRIILSKRQFEDYHLVYSAHDQSGKWFTQVSWSGSNPWRPLAHYKAGGELDRPVVVDDFDGNGIDDLFYAQDGNWYVSNDGTGEFRVVGASSVAMSDLLFGDFNGDGETDVLWPGKGKWRVSWSARSPWEAMNDSPVTSDEMLVGDFNGDGQDDALYVSGTEWLVSWSASSDWEVLNHSRAKVDDLVVGDFDGDGVDDILLADGETWRVSNGGTSSWTEVAASALGADELLTGDFDGDGKTDVMNGDGSSWMVSYAARSAWRALASSSATNERVVIGDFNGDSISDVVQPWTSPRG